MMDFASSAVRLCAADVDAQDSPTLSFGTENSRRVAFTGSLGKGFPFRDADVVRLYVSSMILTPFAM
jgi:hypothetical protein